MRKLVLIGAAVAGSALIVRGVARGLAAFDMAGCIEAMPDSAPPKWMFTNISAIRRNTEQILDLLQPEPREEGAAADVEAVHSR
jgi:hypothetical protein